MPPSSLDAILFDLDGTLADTLGLIVASFNAAISPITGRSYSMAEVTSRFGVTDTVMLQREVPHEHWERVVEQYHAFYEARHDTATVFPGIGEMLERVRALGLPMGVMTGKGRRTADITLRVLGWTSFFDAVITGDEATRPKPNPDGLLQVAEILHAAPPRCVYIGDSPNDIKAARAAGMKAIAIAWHDHYIDRVRPLNPDAWATEPGEVAGLLAGM